jgi:hypothetical protein
MLPWALNKAFVLCLQDLIAYWVILDWNLSTANLAGYGTMKVIVLLRSQLLILLTSFPLAFD